ncbi:MAG TPA: hypothetical protein GX525_00445 [Bacilli bacterium]|nr:hypothetical protein [Bacilli bacterium]
MKNVLLIIFFMFFSLIGCSNSNDNMNILITEKSLPSYFDEVASKSEQAPQYKYLIKKVKTRLEYENEWKYFQLKNDIKDVDLANKDVIFIGLNESGSCPYGIEKLSIDYNKLLVTLKLPDGDCTTDSTPRVFVIDIPKDISNQLSEVNIIEGKVKTSIQIK